MERYPFQLAIEDENLLKLPFEQLSWPQQVALKAFYGCPLSAERVNPKTNWSELDYWAITQGSCEYDHLGYVQKVIPIPYLPREYEQIWGVIGRRSGKTSTLQAMMIAYEATLGGHEQFVKEGQENTIYLIAHRLNLATASINFVRGILRESPFLSKEIVPDGTALELRLKNGIKVVPSPPSLKAQRGFAVPVVGMDEVGFWYTDPDSANPDIEVEAAVRYAQMQFPNSKRIGISTPWSKEGLLWKYYQAGTGGSKLPEGADKTGYEDVLVIFSPTAAFENPTITRKKLESLLREDPDKYRRESLCQFIDSISSFLASALIERAANKAQGVAERAPVEKKEKIQPIYVAAMDPAFRHDSFAFCICHKSTTEGVVVDVLRRWEPVKGQKLNPTEVLTEIEAICKLYDIQTLMSDQYQLESLQQLALAHGLSISGVDITGKSKAQIFGSLQQLVNQQKLVLLDPNLSDDCRILMQELISLERRTGASGRILISAPEGKHDDMASVLALAAHTSLWLDPIEHPDDVVKEPTVFERCMDTLKRKKDMEHTGYGHAV